jgi:U3 small nucleolar RNA-associated protein 18
VSWQIDGVQNPKIQSIFLENFPIYQAAFAAGGSHVIATSRRKHFYTLDLASASVEKVTARCIQPCIEWYPTQQACAPETMPAL